MKDRYPKIVLCPGALRGALRPQPFKARCENCGHHQSEHIGGKAQCAHRLKLARGCGCQLFVPPISIASISTQDNLWKYRVTTTAHGATATCLQPNCGWTLTLETGTIRASFTGAESRARQHYHQAHGG